MIIVYNVKRRDGLMKKISDNALNAVAGGMGDINILETADGKWVYASGRIYDTFPERKFLGGELVQTKDGRWVHTLWGVFDDKESAENFDPKNHGLILTQPKNPDGPTVLEIPVEIKIKT